LSNRNFKTPKSSKPPKLKYLFTLKFSHDSRIQQIFSHQTLSSLHGSISHLNEKIERASQRTKRARVFVKREREEFEIQALERETTNQRFKREKVFVCERARERERES
jgi:hypothetical protein